MKKTIILLFLAAFGLTHTYAQYHLTYDWVKTPLRHDISESEAALPSVGILEKYIVEYKKGAMPQLISVFETTHTITRVNDEDGINRHNTVYIPMYGVKSVVEIKARTVTKDGNITLLDESQIKEVNNVDDYGDFKIFAINGVETESEIEVLYTVEKEYDLHGYQLIQRDYPIKKAEFLYITDGLDAKIKAYRTTAQFEPVMIQDRPARLIVIENIPAMVEEEYATPNANKIEVVFQCYPEGQSISQDMFWDNVVNNVSMQTFPQVVHPQAQEDVDAMFTAYDDLNTYQIVTMLDEYVKTNFNIVQNNNPELSDVNAIFTNRTSSEFGILKAYAHYLKALGIPYEIVITANRYMHKFDPDFFNPNALREFLIFIPGEKKYLSPNSIEYRLGEAPFNILGNYGLFIPENQDNYYFSEIVQFDDDFSRIDRVTDITFDADITAATIKQYQEYSGHWSATNRAVLALSGEQGKKDFQDYLTSSGIEDKEIIDYETRHNELAQMEYNQPFVVDATIRSESLLEEAGDSYIFHLGKVIGTQSELYQETERVNPIEMTYPNQYDYKITVHIPEGYYAEGLDVLELDKSYLSVRGNKLCKFESKYELDGNRLIVTIQEYYRSNEYDLARYEEFRQVINAASDFNKASILLTPID